MSKETKLLLMIARFVIWIMVPVHPFAKHFNPDQFAKLIRDIEDEYK